MRDFHETPSIYRASWASQDLDILSGSQQPFRRNYLGEDVLVPRAQVVPGFPQQDFLTCRICDFDWSGPRPRVHRALRTKCRTKPAAPGFTNVSLTWDAFM